MILYIPVILFLGLLTTSDATIDLACHFPDQMEGSIELQLNRDHDTNLDMLGYDYYLLEVDYTLQRARFNPDWYEVEPSVYIQDLENNTIYRFPNEAALSKGPCTYTELTDATEIPSGRPEGWLLIFDNIWDTFDIYFPPNHTEQSFNRYRMHSGSVCNPSDMDRTFALNSTASIKLRIDVDGFTLDSYSRSHFFPDTSSCEYADFDSFYLFTPPGHGW